QLIPLKNQWEDLNKRKSFKRQVTEYCTEHKGKTFEAEKQPT
ncbi:11271_t:CDS:1, partial [Funneliformis geosporum]